ncbi:MAG: 2-C-methyl-D-erythritol 4-phosphate cytidylyltransferase [Paludibacteraceae bacterium]|nr:2-C-methyl-D-erythritol 4-phosphate cytidylyltransferase [Paludibacteraceae bacterium]
MKNIAVILAGGVGSRLGSEKPKQFLEICGRMVIERTIDAFEKNERIDEIAIVMNPEYVGEMEEIARRNRWRKVSKVLNGGAERYFSTLSAIDAYKDADEVNLIFHDAVRPMVSQTIIEKVTDALEGHDAVGVAVKVTDTIWETDGETIKSIPDRNIMRKAQTPQAFRLSVIKEAYRRGLQDPKMCSTDDCGMVMRYMSEKKIYIVEGEERNIKLTYKEDVPYIEMLLNKQK